MEKRGGANTDSWGIPWVASGIFKTNLHQQEKKQEWYYFYTLKWKETHITTKLIEISFFFILLLC